MNKRITNLSIRGLNTSMPDSTVPDGACEILDNMRFRDGTWQSVGNYSNKAFKMPFGTIKTKPLAVHNVDGKTLFVVSQISSKQTVGSTTSYSLTLQYYDNPISDSITSGYPTTIRTISTSSNQAELEDIDIRVTTFGKVLVVVIDGITQYYVWNDGKYTLFTTPKPVNITENVLSATPQKADFWRDNVFAVWNLYDGENRSVIIPTNRVDTLEWWGEICYLVAYRMTDGSIISPSSLHILCSEERDDDRAMPMCIAKDKKEIYFAIILANKEEKGENEGTYYLPTTTNRLRSFKPSISVTIDDNIDTSLIDRVALYATRINSIFDFEKLTNAFTEFDLENITSLDDIAKIKASQFYADNDLPNQPLYLVDEVEITSIIEQGGSWDVELGYDKFKDISTVSQMYKPTQVHYISADTFYDYNNRLHLGNLTSKLYTPEVPISKAYFNRQNIYGAKVRIQFEDGHSVYSTDSIPETSTIENHPIYWEGRNIISYPDYRASFFEVVGTVGHEPSISGYLVDSVKLQAAIANNFAYYIPMGEDVKYTNIIKPSSGSFSSKKPNESPIISEPNRIQVSAPNNPFSLPFENSYAVGNEGSRVLAMNTVADSLVDSNFYGNYPLYIFTSDGIFALRVGSGEVLYAGTEIVNHDKLINPNTIALNGSVAYACTEGLKALAGRQSVRISADIDNNIDFSRANFSINWKYGELICQVGDNIFIWNAGAGVWSTRSDVVGDVFDGYILTQSDEIANPILLIYYINEESDGPNSIELLTRPLKFDSLGFKKIEMMLARLASIKECSWEIKIESSNDFQKWVEIKNVSAVGTKDVGLRRFPQSARYYRLSIKGTTLGKESITQIDWVIQDRYNNKLR